MNQQTIRRITPVKMVGLYLALGVVWFGPLRRLVTAGIERPETTAIAETVLLWSFVGASGLLIFGLGYVWHRQVEESKTALRTTTEKFQVLHRVFRHNIRNDINIVQAHLELLQRQLPEGEHRSTVTEAYERTEHITRISNKVRVINRIDPEPPSDTEVDLVALVTEELDRVRRRYPDVTITTTLPDRVNIIGDSTVVYAIREVLENAIEHNTKPMDEREIEIAIEREYGHVILEIDDNGPSIPSTELDVIRQGVETPLKHTSGIGLWLVTWLTRYHDGTVDFDSDPSLGTTVRFRFKAGTDIPLYRPKSADQPNQARQTAA